MHKLEENQIKNTPMIGSEYHQIANKITRLIDFIYDEGQGGVDWSFFDINGSVLLYGIPGVGKTTLAMNCIDYALTTYGVDSYTIETSEIIVSNLGESTRNLYEELNHFAKLDQGILFIDELDRICVSRNNIGDVSELKRMLIELMRFLDSMTLTSRKLIFACTNVIDQIDPALIRRFSLKHEFHVPSMDEKREFMQLCMEKCGLNRQNIKTPILEKYQTMDDIKSAFRNAIFNNSLDQYISTIVEEE